jgi:hypothetical protein
MRLGLSAFGKRDKRWNGARDMSINANEYRSREIKTGRFRDRHTGYQFML